MARESMPGIRARLASSTNARVASTSAAGSPGRKQEAPAPIGNAPATAIATTNRVPFSMGEFYPPGQDSSAQKNEENAANRANF
jgi:hypothetical protein